MKKIIFLTLLSLSAFVCLSAQDMNNKRLDKILKEKATELEGDKGAWTLTYRNRLLLVLTDQRANRMRIFTPIIEAGDLTKKEMEILLAANFHSALDAKYCISEEYVLSVFTHPLKELTEAQFIDALDQVVNLADTYGTTYNSTEFVFPKTKKEKKGKKT